MTKDKAGAWINGHQKALATLTAALGEGVLIANGGRNKFASGFMLETFTTGQISIVQAAAEAGIVNQVHANMCACSQQLSSLSAVFRSLNSSGCRTDGSGPHKTNADVRDALAAFLIGTGPYQYFSGPYVT